MKNQITSRLAIAAVFCLGAATVAGAQMNPAASRTWGPGLIQAGGQMSPLAARAFLNGPSNNPSAVLGGQMIPLQSGTLGNGFVQGNPMMPNSVIPNMANGFNPFNTQANTAVGAFFGGASPFSTFYGAANNGYAGGYYGGYYGGGDPTIAVTPYGVVPLGNGYQGGASDTQILNSAYAQGYQDAMSQAAQSVAANADANYPTGMTATPRGAVARVPHGSDGMRVSRVGRDQVNLRWQGDPRIASSVTFSVTDRSGRTLRSTTVSELPAEVRFTPPPNAAFYQAVVHYVDGATNTIMGRLPQ